MNPSTTQGPITITEGTTTITGYQEIDINGVFEVKKGAILNITKP